MTANDSGSSLPSNASRVSSPNSVVVANRMPEWLAAMGIMRQQQQHQQQQDWQSRATSYIPRRRRSSSSSTFILPGRAAVAAASPTVPEMQIGSSSVDGGERFILPTNSNITSGVSSPFLYGDPPQTSTPPPYQQQQSFLPEQYRGVNLPRQQQQFSSGLLGAADISSAYPHTLFDGRAQSSLYNYDHSSLGGNHSAIMREHMEEGFPINSFFSSLGQGGLAASAPSPPPPRRTSREHAAYIRHYPDPQPPGDGPGYGEGGTTGFSGSSSNLDLLPSHQQPQQQRQFQHRDSYEYNSERGTAERWGVGTNTDNPPRQQQSNNPGHNNGGTAVELTEQLLDEMILFTLMGGNIGTAAGAGMGGLRGAQLAMQNRQPPPPPQQQQQQQQLPGFLDYMSRRGMRLPGNIMALLELLRLQELFTRVTAAQPAYALPPLAEPNLRLLDKHSLTMELAWTLESEGIGDGVCTICQERFLDLAATVEEAKKEEGNGDITGNGTAISNVDEAGASDAERNKVKASGETAVLADTTRSSSVALSSSLRNPPSHGSSRHNHATLPDGAEAATAAAHEREEAGRRSEAPIEVCRLPCNHVFCWPCLSEWITRTRTCPNCRLELKDIRSLYNAAAAEDASVAAAAGGNGSSSSSRRHNSGAKPPPSWWPARLPGTGGGDDVESISEVEDDNEEEEEEDIVLAVDRSQEGPPALRRSPQQQQLHSPLAGSIAAASLVYPRRPIHLEDEDEDEDEENGNEAEEEGGASTYSEHRRESMTLSHTHRSRSSSQSAPRSVSGLSGSQHHHTVGIDSGPFASATAARVARGGGEEEEEEEEEEGDSLSFLSSSAMEDEESPYSGNSMTEDDTLMDESMATTHSRSAAAASTGGARGVAAVGPSPDAMAWYTWASMEPQHRQRRQQQQQQRGVRDHRHYSNESFDLSSTGSIVTIRSGGDEEEEEMIAMANVEIFHQRMPQQQQQHSHRHGSSISSWRSRLASSPLPNLQPSFPSYGNRPSRDFLQESLRSDRSSVGSGTSNLSNQRRQLPPSRESVRSRHHHSHRERHREGFDNEDDFDGEHYEINVSAGNLNNNNNNNSGRNTSNEVLTGGLRSIQSLRNRGGGVVPPLRTGSEGGSVGTSMSSLHRVRSSRHSLLRSPMHSQQQLLSHSSLYHQDGESVSVVTSTGRFHVPSRQESDRRPSGGSVRSLRASESRHSFSIPQHQQQEEQTRGVQRTLMMHHAPSRQQLQLSSLRSSVAAATGTNAHTIASEESGSQAQTSLSSSTQRRHGSASQASREAPAGLQPRTPIEESGGAARRNRANQHS